MPDGPPWITTVEEYNWRHEEDTLHGYHIELDENRLWTVKFYNENHFGNEFSLKLYKPSASIGHGSSNSEVFLDYNPYYSNAPGQPGRDSYTNFKFDNEDIYVHAMFKDRPDPGLPWKNCSPIWGQRDHGDAGWTGLKCVFASETRGSQTGKVLVIIDFDH